MFKAKSENSGVLKTLIGYDMPEKQEKAYVFNRGYNRVFKPGFSAGAAE